MIVSLIMPVPSPAHPYFPWSIKLGIGLSFLFLSIFLPNHGLPITNHTSNETVRLLDLNNLSGGA